MDVSFNKVIYNKYNFVMFVVFFVASQAFSQSTDTLRLKENLVADGIHKPSQNDTLYNFECQDFYKKDCCKFHIKSLIFPVILISAGLVGVHSDWMESENHNISSGLTKRVKKDITIDNYTQYAPMLAVYGLNLVGIKGRHDFEDRTIILATSYMIMGITVNSLKRITKEERPDGSDNKSFPSGHTATAFMGAQFLWDEYKDVSPWIGVAGYVVASGTGFLRMYNKKHWFTDVVGGAGIGILSTKAAYWLYPTIKNKFFSGKHTKNIMAFPYYDTKSAGICCTINF